MKRLFFLALAITLNAAAIAQNWKQSYQAGLDAVQAGQWADARLDFQMAGKDKPGDIAKGTPESSSIFKQNYWRDGAPYSPVFLAAYSGLKEALMLPGSQKNYLLKQVASEFEGLIGRGEYCTETFFFLDETYVLLSENDKRIALGTQFNDLTGAMTWKVDQAGIEADDKSLIAQLPAPAKNAKPAKNDLETTSEVSKPRTATYTTPVVTTPAVVKPAPQQANPQPAAPQTSSQPVSSSATETTEQVLPSTSSPPVQGKAAGPTAPAPDMLPAPQTADPDSGQAPAAIEPALKPLPKTKGKPVQAPTATGDSNGQSTSTTTDGQPAPSIPAPKPARKGRDRRPKKDDTTQPAEAAFTGVAPVEIRKIEHPIVAKIDPKLAALAVPVLPSKYALIVGNSESKMENGAIPFAGDDAQALRSSLIADAGYSDQNIEVVINATADQIAATVNALASRVDDKGTVFIYFTGAGANIEGKDYLAGVDSDISNDSSTMISKDDVYKAFMLKGARIFAFFQCSRPIVDGHFFGSEVPMVGSIAQMQSTLPGQSVYGINTDGKVEGLFTASFIDTLKTIRSNQTPIIDFGWQLFYALRRGGTGSEGGSSNQSPSLPVLTNMASDARF